MSPNNKQPLEQGVFITTRQSYVQAGLEVSGRYDKWVLTLSGGALAISITFLEKIAKNPTPATLPWLEYSWLFLIACMLTALSSLVTSQYAINENLKMLDFSYTRGVPTDFGSLRRFTRLTAILNWVSLGSFIIGVALLGIFSFNSFRANYIQGGRYYVQEDQSIFPERKSYRVWICPGTTPLPRGEEGLHSAPSPSPSAPSATAPSATIKNGNQVNMRITSRL